MRTDSPKSLDEGSHASDNPVMSNEDRDPVHLHRIGPAQNMRRFYSLAIQPTLFDGASVIRNWGRIGTNGQSMIETFDSGEDAISATTRLERAKRRRGYHDAGSV